MNNNKHLMNSSHLNQFISKRNINAFLNSVALQTSAEFQCEFVFFFSGFYLIRQCIAIQPL